MAFNRLDEEPLLLGDRGSNAVNLEADIENLKRRNAKLERLIHKLGSKEDGRSFNTQITREVSETTRLAKQIMANLKSCEWSPTLKRLQKAAEHEIDSFSRITQKINQRQQNIVSALSYEEPTVLGERKRSVSRQDQLMEQNIDLQFLELDVEEVKRRQEGVDQVCRDVLELNEMFKDLNVLVNEQQETLDCIEDNIQSTKGQVEQGNQQLRIAENYQKKARKKKCCILMLLLIVLVGIVLGAVVLPKVSSSPSPAPSPAPAPAPSPSKPPTQLTPFRGLRGFIHLTDGLFLAREMH